METEIEMQAERRAGFGYRFIQGLLKVLGRGVECC